MFKHIFLLTFFWYAGLIFSKIFMLWDFANLCNWNIIVLLS